MKGRRIEQWQYAHTTTRKRCSVRASSGVLRKLAGLLTLREARAYLDETCIKIEVEKAGLTESAA